MFEGWISDSGYDGVVAIPQGFGDIERDLAPTGHTVLRRELSPAIYFPGFQSPKPLIVLSPRQWSVSTVGVGVQAFRRVLTSLIAQETTHQTRYVEKKNSLH